MVAAALVLPHIDRLCSLKEYCEELVKKLHVFIKSVHVVELVLQDGFIVKDLKRVNIASSRPDIDDRCGLPVIFSNVPVVGSHICFWCCVDDPFSEHIERPH